MLLASLGPTRAEGLFAPLVGTLADTAAAQRTPDMAVIRSRDVSLDAAYMAARIAPEGVDDAPNRISLAPPAGIVRIELFRGITLNFERTSLDEAFGGGFVWTGRSRSGVSATADLVIRGGKVTGVVNVGSRLFRIDPLGIARAHRISELDGGAFPGDIQMPIPPQPRGEVPFDPPANTVTEITVLIAYTARARDSVADIVAQANLAISRANTAFSRSNVLIRFTLVGTRLVAGYDEAAAASYQRVLEDLTNGTTSGPFAPVHQQRDSTAADLVALLMTRTEYCGIAWLVEQPNASMARFGMSVTTVSCIAGETFSHELGHNMGLRHDRYVEPSAPNTQYNYGHVSQAGGFRTIMAYANRCPTCARINNFSNPGVSHNGHPTGIAAGNPEAADAARKLNETRAGIASYRTGGGTPPRPANDNFANRVTIANPGVVTGSNVNATAETGEPNHAGVSTARNSVWWRYTPATTGPVTLSTAGTGFDTVLAVYTGTTVSNLTAVASNDNFGGTTQSQVTFQGTAGTSYAIAVAGKANAAGTITLTLTAPPPPPPPPPANDNFANRVTISAPRTVTGTNVNATAETGEPNHAGISTARNSVWWRYTPGSSGEITINTFGSNFDTVLAVYTGGSVGNLTPVASNDDAGGTLQSQVAFQGTAGTSYAIAVAGYGGRSGNISLTVQGGGATTTTIVAAVTPVARATQVGSTVTAFATVLNQGSAAATSCSVAVPGGNPLTFTYRTRNHNTGALGTVNRAANIAAGGRQDFLMSFTPTGAMQRELALVFDCANTPPAPSAAGLNTFMLIGTSSAPPADIISIAVTATNDGIMNIPLNGTGIAVLAAQNIGASATIQARLSASPILSPTSALPNTTSMLICRTNPTTGACLANPAPTVNFTPTANQIVTFTAFVTSNGRAIPFRPADTRLFVNFFQGNTPVGSASVAARTVTADPGEPEQAAALVD